MIGLIHDLYVVATNPNRGSLTEYFLKSSSHVLLLFSGKGKTPLYG